jgi:hypothetical protein
MTTRTVSRGIVLSLLVLLLILEGLSAAMTASLVAVPQESATAPRGNGSQQGLSAVEMGVLQQYKAWLRATSYPRQSNEPQTGPLGSPPTRSPVLGTGSQCTVSLSTSTRVMLPVRPRNGALAASAPVTAVMAIGTGDPCLLYLARDLLYRDLPPPPRFRSGD